MPQGRAGTRGWATDLRYLRAGEMRPPARVAVLCGIVAGGLWGPGAGWALAAPAPTPPRSLLEAYAGPAVGPHAFGNEACNEAARTCVRTGRFFGVGASAGIRLGLAGPVYLDLGFHGVANGVRSKPLYRGFVAPQVGMGLYGRRIFARAAYVHGFALGPEEFEAPFSDVAAGSARWGRSAFLLTAGPRFPVGRRTWIEPWGGLMVGPRERRVYQGEEETRLLWTFAAGIRVAVAVVRPAARSSAAAAVGPGGDRPQTAVWPQGPVFGPRTAGPLYGLPWAGARVPSRPP